MLEVGRTALQRRSLTVSAMLTAAAVAVRDVGAAFRVLPILIVSARAPCISLCVPDGPSAAPSLVFSAQEHLLLQEENHHLLDSLEDNLDAMRRAESQLAAIASLMTLFSTKVLKQEEQIGTIYDQAIKSQNQTK